MAKMINEMIFEEVDDSCIPEIPNWTEDMCKSAMDKVRKKNSYKGLLDTIKSNSSSEKKLVEINSMIIFATIKSLLKSSLTPSLASELIDKISSSTINFRSASSSLGIKSEKDMILLCKERFGEKYVNKPVKGWGCDDDFNPVQMDNGAFIYSRLDDEKVKSHFGSINKIARERGDSNGNINGDTLRGIMKEINDNPDNFISCEVKKYRYDLLISHPYFFLGGEIKLSGDCDIKFNDQVYRNVFMPYLASGNMDAKLRIILLSSNQKSTICEDYFDSTYNNTIRYVLPNSVKRFGEFVKVEEEVFEDLFGSKNFFKIWEKSRNDEMDRVAKDYVKHLKV